MKQTPFPKIVPVISQPVWEEAGRALVRANLSLPAAEGLPRAAQRRVNGYYRRFALRLEKYCASRLLRQAREAAAQADFRAFELRCGFTVTYCGGGLLSLYTDVRESRPASESVLRFGDIWLTDSGTPLYAPDFFPQGVNFRAALLDGAAERCCLRQPGGRLACAADTRKVMRKALRLSDVYLTEEVLAVFFQQRALPFSEEDIPVFVLPFAPGGPSLPEI